MFRVYYYLEDLLLLKNIVECQLSHAPMHGANKEATQNHWPTCKPTENGSGATWTTLSVLVYKPHASNEGRSLTTIGILPEFLW